MNVTLIQKHRFCIALVLIIFLGLISCRTDNSDNSQTEAFNKIIFSVEDTIIFPIEEGQSIYSRFQMYDDTTLLILDTKNNQLRFLDMPSMAYTSIIDLNLYSHQYIIGFHVINKDSIILCLNPAYLGFLHDYPLIMVNDTGEIIKTYSFKGGLFPS